MILVEGLELEGNDTSTKLIGSRMQRILCKCKGISDLDAKTLLSNIIPVWKFKELVAQMAESMTSQQETFSLY